MNDRSGSVLDIENAAGGLDASRLLPAPAVHELISLLVQENEP